MKKNLKNLLNKLLILLIISALVPLGGHFFLPPLVLNTLNLVILLIIIPFCLLLLSNLSLPKNIPTLLLLIITIFFFVYTPIVFIANHALDIPLKQMPLTIINSIIITLAILKIIIFPKAVPSLNHSFSKSNILLFTLSLVIGVILHLIFFHFYTFIPETDGYAKMIEINNIINGDDILIYRGLFTTAIAIMSLVSSISVYSIFSVYFIFIQLLFISLSIYSIIRHINIPKTIKLLLLLSPYGIPVLNMEIDMVRPQNMLIMFYFIYSALLVYLFTVQKNKKALWIALTLIALSGILYHELFFIITISYVLTIFLVGHRQPKIRKNMPLYLISITGWGAFLIAILYNKISIIQTLLYTPIHIGKKIINLSEWQLWFIDSYGTDTEIGWHGITGAIQYYSYYASPLILFLFFYLGWLLIKNQHYLEKRLLLVAFSPLILFPFAFAEILPRLNYFLYPERMWIFIDLALLLSFVMLIKPLLKIVARKMQSLLIAFLYLLLAIGVIGSIYVASQKRAYTSKNEYAASQWIKKNTPENSLFITQGANGPMIRYFAEREMDSEFKILFNNDLTNKLITLTTPPKDKQKRTLQNINDFLHNKNIANEQDVAILIRKLKQDKKTLQRLSKKIEKSGHYAKIPSPIYALYSKDKFKGIYAQREWWLKDNYYGAHIEDLTKKYPLVYNKNGIYIWKIR